jgi:acetyl esterase/lipase
MRPLPTLSLLFAFTLTAHADPDLRKAVVRWRSPLWMAQVDPATLRLRRDTERVVLPLVGDGVNDPKRVAIMGNFHTTSVTPDESWVTVGEWQPMNGIKGDLLLADALKRHGIEHQLEIIDGAPHTFHLQPKERDLRRMALS